MSALALIDRVFHRLRVPHRFWWRLCDAYDLSMGVPDTPHNFPRRHGFVQIYHVYTGASGGYPGSFTCQGCGKRMDEGGRCLLVRAAA